MEKTNNSRMKTIAALSALSIGLNTGSALASNNYEQDYVSYGQTDVNYDFNVENVYKDIYQHQMKYLVPALERLKEFYIEEDTKNIIKNAYPDKYNIINEDLNYYPVYNGTDYDYYSNNSDLLSEIKKNNMLIRSLDIKRSSSARDTDYGLIPDKNSQFGNRVKTEEDIQLIDRYTSVLGNQYIVDDSLINLIDNVNNSEFDNLSSNLLNTLENLYNKQMLSIYKTRTNLDYFYSNIDDKNIIKEAYPNAYDSYKEDLNYYLISYGVAGDYSFLDKDISENNYNEKELIGKYISLIERNNRVIAGFRIKPIGNSRDTDYGIIPDKNSEFGIRLKTEEDMFLIDNYSLLIDSTSGVDYSILNLLNSVSKRVDKDKTL